MTTSGTPLTAPERLGPWRRWAWLAAAAGVGLLLVAVGFQKIWSADVWWQMRNGRWIVEHLSVPTEEMYSHTSAGTPIREMRWVYCALLHLAWEHAGPWLLVLAQAGLVALTWGVLVWPTRTALRTPVGLLLLALGLAAGFQRWVMRPELVTYLLTAAFLVILGSRRREGRAWRGLWALPLLQVAWVNGHTTFMMGPLLVAAFLAGETLDRIRARRSAEGERPSLIDGRLALTGLLVVAACWANPYGHWGAMYAVEMYVQTRGDHATARTITEMRSPLAIPLGSWMWDLTATAALGLLAGATFVPVLRRVPLARVAVWAMGVYLFLMLQRNTALSALMFVWAGLRNVEDVMAAEPRRAAALRDSAWAAGANVALGAAAAAAAWYVATDRYAARMGLPREFGFGVVEWYQPRGAEAFILEERPAGTLFNVMRDGGYLVRRVSDVLPVYIDGRTDAYSAELLDEAAGISAANWDALAERRGFSTAVVPNAGYADIVRHLLDSPAWGLAHLDETSLVFLRRTAENDPILERREIVPGRAWPAPEGLAERDAVPAWKRAYGGVGRAPRLMGYAASLKLIGELGAARAALEAALRVEPRLHAACIALAPLAWAGGDAARAADLLEGASEGERLAAYREAAGFLERAGDFAGAAAPLERAVAIAPDDAGLRIALADAYFRARDYAKARPAYERALTLGGTAAEWTKLGAVCEHLDDPEAAVRAYQTSLRLDPAQPPVWNMLGTVAARTGDLELARRCFEQALRLAPDFAPARRNLERLRALGGG